MNILKKEIKIYSIYDEGELIGQSEIKTITNLPVQNNWKQIISFRSGEHVVFVNLYGENHRYSNKTLDWDFFNNNEIREIAKTFKLEIRESEILKKENYLKYLKAGVVDVKNQFKTLNIIEFNQPNIGDYIILFIFDDGESRRTPSLYVHSITQIIYN